MNYSPWGCKESDTTEQLSVSKCLGTSVLNYNTLKKRKKRRSLFIMGLQFSVSIVSNYLRPHGLQHGRLPCPSPAPKVYSSSCPLSWWCYSTISSSVISFSSCLQSFPASGTSNESVLCIRWPEYWIFSFSISPSSENPRLISFRMDWLDLLAVQGTLKSLLQHHSSKASILQYSAFFIVQTHTHTWLLEKP